MPPNSAPTDVRTGGGAQEKKQEQSEPQYHPLDQNTMKRVNSYWKEDAEVSNHETLPEHHHPLDKGTMKRVNSYWKEDAVVSSEDVTKGSILRTSSTNSMKRRVSFHDSLPEQTTTDERNEERMISDAIALLESKGYQVTKQNVEGLSEHHPLDKDTMKRVNSYWKDDAGVSTHGEGPEHHPLDKDTMKRVNSYWKEDAIVSTEDVTKGQTLPEHHALDKDTMKRVNSYWKEDAEVSNHDTLPEHHHPLDKDTMKRVNSYWKEDAEVTKTSPDNIMGHTNDVDEDDAILF